VSTVREEKGEGGGRSTIVPNVGVVESHNERAALENEIVAVLTAKHTSARVVE
jgi:hypothetical protein